VIGLLCHIALLLLVALMLIKLLDVTGIWAVGFMILAACPTGTTSNLLTYLARGDVALAISFTAVASIVTIFTPPLIVGWAISEFGGADRAQLTLPLLPLIVSMRFRLSFGPGPLHQ
jgi:bile acid:Na+ symporter, BASS family